MSQFPDKLPESIRQLLAAGERGDLPDIPASFFDRREGDDDLPDGTFSEITNEGETGSLATTNRILLEIVELLREMPTEIWDEIERRNG